MYLHCNLKSWQQSPNRAQFGPHWQGKRGLYGRPQRNWQDCEAKNKKGTITYYNIYWGVLMIKGKLWELQIYFRKIPLHQQKCLVVSVLSNSPWLLRNLKNVQNEITKHFSVGNTRFYSNGASIHFCICCAMTWIRPTVKSRPSMKKTVIIMRPLMELVHGVSVLLIIYWLKEKPNNRKRTLVIG